MSRLLPTAEATVHFPDVQLNRTRSSRGQRSAIDLGCAKTRTHSRRSFEVTALSVRGFHQVLAEKRNIRVIAVDDQCGFRRELHRQFVGLRLQDASA
jgi:hypothetical protein